MVGEKVGTRKVAVRAWPGKSEALYRAVHGPWQAVVWEITNKLGWSRDLYKCRHRHLSIADAFECPDALKEVKRNP